MKTKFLREVVSWFETEPRRLDMHEWHRYRPADHDPNNPPCGTAACLAGSTCIIAGKARPHLSPKYKGFYLSPENGWGETAKELLGLSFAQANRLFRPDEHTSYLHSGDDFPEGADKLPKSKWPKRYADAYRKATTAAERFKVLKNRVNHFIKTRGAE